MKKGMLKFYNLGDLAIDEEFAKHLNNAKFPLSRNCAGYL